MTPLTDSELIKKIKENADGAAMKELISRHSGVYRMYSRPYVSRDLFTYDEALDEKPLTIYSAAMSYDESRGSFGTFLGYVTRNRCCQILKERIRVRKRESCVGDSSSFDILPSKTCSISELESRDGLAAIQKVVGTMTEKKQRVFSKRYFSHTDNSALGKWKKIAQSEGNSKWGCILASRSVEKKIREKVGVELIGRKY